MKIMKTIFFAFVLCACASGPLASAQGSARSKGVESCRKDIERFCKGVAPGEGRVGTCLHEHFKKLSKTCRRFAGHGGPDHRLESLRDIDKALEEAAKR